MRTRVVTALTAAFLLAATSGCGGGGTSGGSDAKPDAIHFLNAGGDSEKSIVEGYVAPFTEKTGVKVVMESPSDLGKLQAMVKSGNVTVDLVELDSNAMAQARSLGLIEKLDWSVINPDPIFDEAKQPDAFGYQYYSTILAWGAGAQPLTSWVDLWDVKKFPGKRTLPDYPTFTLPIALLADGVPLDKLYPLDIDRAFKSLEKIKDQVSVWWQSGAQPPQLLKDGEVKYGASWSGRIVDNTDKLGFTFQGGLLDIAYLAVPKGAKHKKLAEQLLHEMSIAKNEAVAAGVISYTGPSKDLNPLLPPDKLDHYPTSSVNKDVQVLSDPTWWGEHGDEAQKRWEEFKLGL